MSTIAVLDHKACTGCGVCANVCPNSSIKMRPDNKGFLYPHVEDTCLKCGKCVQHCPVLSGVYDTQNRKTPELYAAWSLDISVRYHSTSGGIFTELARQILREHGFVAGAAYTDNHMAEHRLINSEADIPLLRQSKYVQSTTSDIYKKVASALQKQTPVLFAGTPCQCGALTAMLGREYDNLYLCDFICRGVNAPFVYRKYLDELEQKYQSKVKTVRFKDKKYGWNRFGTKIIFENGQEYFEDRDTDPFMYGYIKKDLNLYIRSSCSQCKFKGISRPVDLTLGDFWGVKLEHSSDDMKQGVSALFIQSEKGKKLIEVISKNLYLEKKQLEEVLPGNRCIYESILCDERIYQDFWKAFEQDNKFISLMNIYMNGDYYG